MKRLLCYILGHRWIKEQMDKEIAISSWYCDRCGATDWETKED